MARNRVISNTLAAYVSQNIPISDQTVAGSIKQLSRVQSFDFDFTQNYTDINSLGELAPIDRIQVENSTIKATLSYLLTDGGNENSIGLTTTNYLPVDSTIAKNCLYDIVKKNKDDKNYYLLVAQEGLDANNGYTGKTGIIGIGNGCVTSYEIKAEVGGLPTVTVGIDALNIKSYSNVSTNQVIPAVDPENVAIINNYNFKLPSSTTNSYYGQITALRPGDITLNVTGILGYNNSDLKVQDFTLSFNLDRDPLKKVGKQFPFARELKFPIMANLELNAVVGDLKSDNIINTICEPGYHNFDIALNSPECTNKTVAVKYMFKGAKLVSQNFNSSIDNSATIKASYEIPLSDVNDTSRGIFIYESSNKDTLQNLRVINSSNPNFNNLYFYKTTRLRASHFTCDPNLPWCDGRSIYYDLTNTYALWYTDNFGGDYVMGYIYTLDYIESPNNTQNIDIFSTNPQLFANFFYLEAPGKLSVADPSVPTEAFIGTYSVSANYTYDPDWVNWYGTLSIIKA